MVCVDAHRRRCAECLQEGLLLFHHTRTNAHPARAREYIREFHLVAGEPLASVFPGSDARTQEVPSSERADLPSDMAAQPAEKVAVKVRQRIPVFAFIGTGE